MQSQNLYDAFYNDWRKTWIYQIEDFSLSFVNFTYEQTISIHNENKSNNINWYYLKSIQIDFTRLHQISCGSINDFWYVFWPLGDMTSVWVCLFFILEQNHQIWMIYAIFCKYFYLIPKFMLSVGCAKNGILYLLDGQGSH